jgi:hypothetical protein
MGSAALAVCNYDQARFVIRIYGSEESQIVVRTFYLAKSRLSGLIDEISLIKSVDKKCKFWHLCSARIKDLGKD